MSSHERSQISHQRIELHEAVPLATPLVVYVEPSGYCNLKCGFCPVGLEGDQLKKAVMSYALFAKLVDDMGAFPGKVKLLRVCGNGDPLVNTQLVPMLRYARERGAAERIELLSNGILLNDELIRELPKVLDRLIISIEGLNAGDYLETCGARVDFEAFQAKLKALYETRGSCTLHLKIHHGAIKNEADAAAFKALVEPCSDEHYIEKLVPMWPELDSALFSREFRWEEAPVKPRQVCAQIFKGIQVQADGEVVPCCVDWKRVNLLGHLQDQTLSEIWNGARLKQLQIHHLSGHKPDLSPCRSCTMNDHCEYDDLDAHAKACLERIRDER